MMRSIVLLVVSAAFNMVQVSAQLSVDELPYTFIHGLDKSGVPTAMPAPFDKESVALEDLQRAENGELPAYGRALSCSIDPLNNGLWTELGGGDRIWRICVTSPGAMGIELFYTELQLPEGALLHVYDVAGSQLLGAFSEANNSSSGLFASAQLLGESCIVEYFEPATVRGQGYFKINEVGHAYVMPGMMKADACEVDVNCSEGAAWQDERDGVVRISVKQGTTLGWCSGSLVNNTDQDCRSFILTAFHCGEGSSTANFAQYKFYFGYQRAICGSGFASASQLLTGCDKRADSNDGGGNNGSDFMLLETTQPIPLNYSPFWIGWDATGNTVPNGVCIHHPAGDEKKISTFTNQLLTSPLYIGGPLSHWRVVWSATTNGHGVTEGGSSGSAVFNSSGQIVGTLTGGTSCCVVNGCGINGSGPNTPDYYGKMSYHWTNNPNSAAQKLKVWLDPGNTGALVLNGSADPCNVNAIGENTYEQILVYPVPASTRITIRGLDASADNSSIQVMDITGKLVMQQSISSTMPTINVENLPEGAYVMRLLQGDRAVSTSRFLVVR